MRLKEWWRLFYHTVGYLRWRQITGRVVRHLRPRILDGMLPESPASLQGSLQPPASFPVRETPNTKAAIEQGRFCFLNELRQLGRPIDWQPVVSDLWRFNLHYFQYLHLIGASEQRSICREWIDKNSVGRHPGWHPYPTSLRIINWCKAEFEAEDILQSLYRQTAYLYRHPETHLLGNHLLENARALVFAGSFFGKRGEAPQWLKRGLKIYRDQTPEQILDDGGHFERSPMYHALMLEGYVDVLNLLPEGHRDWHWLAKTVRKMSDFLLSMTHPGSRIALFNDSTQDEFCPTEELLAYAGRVLDLQPGRRSHFEESGYYIHNPDDVYLVIDGGPIGPDYLPAHAHADIFSYELSVDGVLFIVDTGVYEYEAGDMRNYVRSTRAHNTVCVDGRDQAECWDSFRVARRYTPHGVSFTQQTDHSRFKGCFNGYAQLIGDQIAHQRCIEADQNEQRITVEDGVTGEGTHTVESRIQLHPEVRVQQERNGIVLERSGRTLHISMGDSTVRFENGWYCPEFGLQESNTVIVLGGEHSLPVHLRYSIRY